MQEGRQWKGGLSANKNDGVYTQQGILVPTVKTTLWWLLFFCRWTFTNDTTDETMEWLFCQSSVVHSWHCHIILIMLVPNQKHFSVYQSCQSAKITGEACSLCMHKWRVVFFFLPNEIEQFLNCETTAVFATLQDYLSFWQLGFWDS